jgi:hypothetical protein
MGKQGSSLSAQGKASKVGACHDWHCPGTLGALPRPCGCLGSVVRDPGTGALHSLFLGETLVDCKPHSFKMTCPLGLCISWVQPHKQPLGEPGPLCSMRHSTSLGPVVKAPPSCILLRAEFSLFSWLWFLSSRRKSRKES